ncbi:MAG: ABC transporter ATP-binding protein, partial [Varibaculum cambriense]|nr:ABC transporter ATP-binding protein [Varibaculum cambriense]
MTDHQVSEPGKDTAENIKLRSKQGRAALRELLAPVQMALRVGQVMAVISAILRVFPFVALVGIGNELLTSLGKGVSPN